MGAVCDGVTLQNGVTLHIFVQNFDYCVLFEVVYHLSNRCATIAKKNSARCKRNCDTFSLIILYD